MTRALFVSDMPPTASGARTALVTQALAELGDVDAVFIAGPRDAVRPEDHYPFARTVVVPACVDGGRPALPEWVTENGYDVVWFARERAWLPFRGRITAPAVIDAGEPEDARIRHWLGLGLAPGGGPLTPWRRLRATRELVYWRSVHRLVAREADVLVHSCRGDRLRDDRTVVVPQTCGPVKDEEPLPLPGRVILLTGDLDAGPDEAAARWLVEEITPLIRDRVPEATVVLAGPVSPAVARLATERTWVTTTGPLSASTAALRAAELLVAPLRVGDGRARILEAFAHGVPVVSTTAGSAGLDVVPGLHVAVADDAAGLAARCVALLIDDEARSRLAAAGRRLHEERHLPAHVRAQVHRAVRMACRLPCGID